MKLVAAVCLVVLAGGTHARADDWGPTRDPFDRGVVARYQAILARDPYDPVLARLAALYQRARTLDALLAEYEARLAAHPDDDTTLVVLGRLLEHAHQPARALAAYQRAESRRPDDPLLALRIASLERAANHLEEAREAYERAATVGAGPSRREALQALIELARARRDRVAVAFHTRDLAALEPRDPRLQLDLGDALLAIDLVDAALVAYANAERLSATDPPRRIDAIVRRAAALEPRDRPEAEAEYRRAMAQLPRDHYLRRELFGRLVELHRAAGTLGGLLAMALADWPESSRGAFEWYELAGLHDAVGDRARGLAALERAAARTRESRLHLELADRYPPERTTDMLAVLGKLAARAGDDLPLLSSIAERYARRGHLALAFAIYDKLLRRDPATVDRLVTLVDESFRVNRPAMAAALTRSVVPRLTTAEAHGRLATILLEWGDYEAAVSSFGRALALAPTSLELWRGRAAAHDALGHIGVAVADGTRALELAGTDAKLRRTVRKELVRIVLHASGESGARAALVDRWRTAFRADPADVEAGFLLLAYFEVAPCEHWVSNEDRCGDEAVEIITRLGRLAPLDPDDIIALATAYSAAQRHDAAIAILHALRAHAPEREPDIVARIEKVERWRLQPDPFQGASGLANGEGLVDPESEILAITHRSRRRREAIAEPLRLAIRIGYGEALRGGVGQLSAGVMGSALLGNGLFLTSRLDVARHDGTGSFTSFGGSIGMAKVLASSRSTSFVLGVGERLERRWGEAMEAAGYGPVGLAAEATFDVVGRRLPAVIGARLEQGMSDDGRSTALMVEAAFELR